MLEELFADQPVDVKQMMGHLRKTAEDQGLPFGERQKTYNSRLAQELGLWAESQNKGDAFHLAAFRAYFAEGKNLAKIPVLLDIAESVKLPPEEAKAVLETRSFRRAVDEDWALARDKGIKAVPTFVINEEALVGAKPYDVLARFVEANGVRKRR